MFAVCQRVFSKWIVETWTCRSDFEWTVIFLCCWNIVIALKIHQISALKCLLWSFIALGFTIVTQGPKTRRFQLFFIESCSTLHLLQNTFYSIKISCF